MAKQAHTDGSTGLTRVRMYRHGLGDCFLIRFPCIGPNRSYFCILVDCGLIPSSVHADTDRIMEAVVQDIGWTTDFHLDVVVVSSKRWDHVSGFDPDKGWFHGFRIDQVWLPWTVDPLDSKLRALEQVRQARLCILSQGLAATLAQARGVSRREAARSRDAAWLGRLEAACEYARRSTELLHFFGIDPDRHQFVRNQDTAEEAQLSRGDRAMGWARTAAEHVIYCRAGDLIDLTSSSGAVAYVLGPAATIGSTTPGQPEPADDLGRTLRAFFGASGPRQAQACPDPTVPFDSKFQIQVDDAEEVDFFRDHYFGSQPHDRESWRRIDCEGITGAGLHAERLIRDANDESLVLAFELPDHRVLLFTGNSDVGHWESWQRTPDGSPRGWKVGNRRITVPELLSRTILYKVGNHGSPATHQWEVGLETLTRVGLTAMITADAYVSRAKGWKIPFDPLMLRLQQITEGRTIQADQPIPSEPSTRDPDFAQRVSNSARTIPVVVDEAGRTKDRSLYVEYVL